MLFKSYGFMVNKFFLSLFVIFLIVNFTCAEPSPGTDTLAKILQVKAKLAREKSLVRYINGYFAPGQANLYLRKVDLIRTLNKYGVENSESLEHFIESDYQATISHPQESEKEIIKAIQAANRNRSGDYLSYAFLSFLAYKQTEEGNVIGAVSSYRLAKKKAIELKDTNLQMVIDINISDVFYKNNFYNQSLFYLNQAETLCNEYWPDDQRFKNVIYYNKAENFFRMNKLDSLRLYNEKLKKSKANTYKLYTYKNRTGYYVLLLEHDYANAISRIHAMLNDGGYKSENQDLQNLGDAYYRNGQPDSARIIINQLLSTPSEANHPEIKYHLYEVLGKIAGQQGDYKGASENFKLSLEQSADIMNRLTQVDNISSLIKVDEIEGYYSQKSESYQRQRVWLIIAVVFAFIIILVIALLYRAIKQKRHFEKLLFANKKEELAFINSHDVRKHLTNILGLMEVIRRGDNKGNEYLQAEDHLFHSSTELDKAIKNISKKLDD